MADSKYTPRIGDMISSGYFPAVHVSPSGQYVAVEARTTDWKRNRFVMAGCLHDRQSGTTRMIGEDMWHLRWRSDAEIAFLKATADDGVQLHLLEHATNVYRQITRHPGGVNRFVVFGEHIIYFAPTTQQSHMENHRYVEVIWGDEGKRGEQLFQIGIVPSGTVSDALVGHVLTEHLDPSFTVLMNVIAHGDSLYLTCRRTEAYQDVAVFRMIVPSDGSHWERIALPNDAGLWAVSPDGQTLLLNWDHRRASGYSNEAPALHTLPASVLGEKPAQIAAASDLFYLSAQWTEGHGIVVRYLQGAQARLGRIEGSRVTSFDLGDRSVLCADAHRNGIIAAIVGGPEIQPGLLVFDQETSPQEKRLVTLTHLENGLSFDPLADEVAQGWAWGAMKTVCWKAGDGVTVEGVLYTPDGHDGKARLPLLVIAHGGPGTASLSVRRDWDDCWLYPVQQLLARGMAVLKPNYRCSDGYGRAFHDAHIGSGRAYRLMLADVEAGVQHLIKDGLVDPDRVGLAGWSAGGGIAAMAAVRSIVFRAISCGAGTSDHLLYFASSIYPQWAPDVFGGYPWEKLQEWTADCAAWQKVERKTPTLIQHGMDDAICTIANANALYLTLKHQGVPVVLAKFPKHGHGVFNHSPKAALTVMSQNLKWFSHHLCDTELNWDAEDELEK